jgi:hypothetical protein
MGVCFGERLSLKNSTNNCPEVRALEDLLARAFKRMVDREARGLGIRDLSVEIRKLVTGQLVPHPCRRAPPNQAADLAEREANFLQQKDDPDKLDGGALIPSLPRIACGRATAAARIVNPTEHLSHAMRPSSSR